MENQSQEARMHLAIGAIRQNRKLSLRTVAKLYNVPRSTLTTRINGIVPLKERRPATHKLTELEEEIIIQHILELDTRGFGPRLADVEDIANNVLKSYDAAFVGKNWAQRFVQRRIELKVRFNREYNFQRALCEDSEVIEEWFRLVANMRAKYGILLPRSSFL